MPNKFSARYTSRTYGYAVIWSLAGLNILNQDRKLIEVASTNDVSTGGCRIMSVSRSEAPDVMSIHQDVHPIILWTNGILQPHKNHSCSKVMKNSNH